MGPAPCGATAVPSSLATTTRSTWPGLETIPGELPLHNCRWVLFARESDDWRLIHRDTGGRTREPSPVALLGQGNLLVSANPTLTESGAHSGPAEPTVFRFNANDIDASPSVEKPTWRDQPEFSEHSYRTVTADAARNEVLYMQNVGYDISQMSFLAGDGGWRGVGELRWPFGETYPKPQPLRLCYPNVILRDRRAHFFGVGDIVEPIEAWRQAKHEITGRDWDYVFRRLFYASTSDITGEPFCEWIEIANRDATAGAMRNNDIWLASDGTAHLIWSETTVDERIRDRFFPGEPVVNSLEYLTIKDGEVLSRSTLATATEDDTADRPELARFHVTPSGDVYILASFTPSGATGAQGARWVYRLARLTAEGTVSEWIDVPFKHPIAGTFLTNTVRGGSAPSDIIDMVGMRPEAPNTMGYARVRIARKAGN